MIETTMPRHKPIAGQLDLFGGPPAAYCRRCGQRLRSEASRAAGIGRLCARIEARRVVAVRFCSDCGERLAAADCGCRKCGQGFTTRTFRVRTRYVPTTETPTC